MPWEIQYYSEPVRREIEAWPVGIRAMYARITERMEGFGPDLRDAVYPPHAGWPV